MSCPAKAYDERHDVLHYYLDSQYNSSADEEKPDIYVIRNDDTDEIVGFKILDYHKNVDKAKAMYPQYDFSLPH